MTNLLKTISAVLFGVALLSVPSLAQAQEVTLRVEPGVAVPVTDPQAQRFGVGGAIDVKPEIGLGSYLSVGPALSYMVLPSRLSGVDPGTALGLSGFARLKRPHDYNHNHGSGFSAASPWVDGDAGYVRTDPLDRFFWTAAAGVSVPTGADRSLWVGPFVRFMDVHEAFDKSTTDTRNSKTVIAGLSFELGPVQKRAVDPTPPPAPPPSDPVVEQPTPQPPPPPPPPPTEIVKFKPRIQFAWDSAVLDDAQQTVLKDVVKSLLADKTYSVRIEGHASSEGQVEHNNKLSVRRAESVRNFLVANGVDGSRLTVEGFGSRVPVADNSTEAGRIQNRRVEFDVSFVVVKESK